jgi:pentatricopeptide repeat protein
MAFFQEMEDKNLDLNIVIFSVLIDGMCNARKLITSREMFSSLPTRGLQWNVPTHNIMIKELCKKGLLNEERELFEKIEEKDCPSNYIT